MEEFSGRRQTPTNLVGFPEHLTPFPEPADMLYDDRMAEICPPEIDHHRSQLPPQKLRPIRCNGRTFPEYSDPVMSERRGAGEASLSCHGKLGFLAQLSPEKLLLVNGVREKCSNTLPDLGSGNVVAGNGLPRMDVPAVSPTGTEMKAEFVDFISESHLLEAELSSSSDDDGDSSKAMMEPVNRKRKRKAGKMLKFFLKNMMRKVIQKQEHMHNQLMKMIEKKEDERIVREEAWKQQEIERAKKDEEIRMEERSRSLAIISFIEDFLGHEIQIPRSLKTSCLDKAEAEIQNVKDLRCDSSNKRWPKSEVQALITIRTALEHKLMKGAKGSVWEEVAVELSNMGYSRSAKKCKEKWDNINKYYKRVVMENGKQHRDNGRTCPYFQELDILYKSGLINAG
ncbi:trihelix transcription factor GTL1 [Diospyros lotus]|uniref:trihelix transcription factor GTL1 n=1 Tax=Diospyros lotus TaxID=55363 RepID=UPI0022502EB1|nr:trihelix transcription factor GTL1 [Diospyros lotus]